MKPPGPPTGVQRHQPPKNWTPATAGNVRAGDVIATKAEWGPRIITVRSVYHTRPGQPLVITTITGMILRLASDAPVAIREIHQYNRGP